MYAQIPETTMSACASVRYGYALISGRDADRDRLPSPWYPPKHTFASISNISPKIYREFVFPYEKELFDTLQEAAAGKKIIGIHICGFIDPIMEDLAQLPLDWIELDGPSSLKGLLDATQGKMIIRGNVGGEIFSEGTKEQIYEAVKNCVDTASDSTKYVISTGCQIPLNAPLDQVRHFIDAALQHGVRN